MCARASLCSCATPDCGTKLVAGFEATVHCAGLLAILRMAVETRRTTLVDLSLDLIQKLIAHSHLAGSVYNISHKRDPAARRSGRKVCCHLQGNPCMKVAPERTVLGKGASVRFCIPRQLSKCRQHTKCSLYSFCRHGYPFCRHGYPVT